MATKKEIQDKYNYSEKGQRTKRNVAYKNKYGITLSQYEEMLKQQQNKCAICKQEEVALWHNNGTSKRLAVDHCHKTNKVRKLLCERCNHIIGRVHEDITVLENAISYLKEYI